VVGWVSVGLGLGGLLVVVLGARSRSPTAVALMMAFGVLAIGGGLVSRNSEATGAWGAVLIATGAALCCVLAASMARRDRRLALQAEEAGDEAAATRREMEALEVQRDDLEEQLQAAHRRTQELIEKAEEDAPVAPARIERYRAHVAALQATEERLRRIIAAARDGIVMLEHETLRLGEFTPSLSDLTGFAPDELVERCLLDLLEQGPGQPGRDDLHRVALERRPLRANLVRADGTRVPVEITLQPVGAEETPALMALIRDVSESARAHQQLEEAREELAERERQLDDVRGARSSEVSRIDELERSLADLRTSEERTVEAVAHDLRVPLTSVRSFSEILLRHEDADPQVQREFLEIIRKESERLTRMIDEYLDVRRIGAGATKMSRVEVALGDLVRDTAASLEGLARERGVTIEGVWDRASHVVTGDRDRLQRMLVTLLGNALQQSSDGGSVEVVLRAGRRDGATLLGIRDHGPSESVPDDGGDEDAGIVFERYHAASAGPDHAPGTGVGLAVCREIAAAHGARMWPDGREGGGRTTWIEFPPPGDAAGEVDDGAAVATGAPA
jgi:PAS domain S-box-containing protein